MASGAKVDNADVRGRFLSGFKQLWQEELGQEGVTDMVGTELDFVAFFGRPWRHSHYARWTWWLVLDLRKQCISSSWSPDDFNMTQRVESVL